MNCSNKSLVLDSILKDACVCNLPEDKEGIVSLIPKKKLTT